MLTRRAALTIGSVLLGICSAPGVAQADVDSLFTLGVGAQYGFLTDAVSDRDGAPERQLGLVSRLKILRFLGAEAATSFDQDPGSQSGRILSPRYQVGAMLNLVPTEHFNLFGVAGTGAQSAGDLFSVGGRTTSFHFGPGLEVFLGEHVAVGGDVRWRMPGPAYIRTEVEAQIEAQALSWEENPEASSEPIEVEAKVGPRTWQANFTVSFYL